MSLGAWLSETILSSSQMSPEVGRPRPPPHRAGAITRGLRSTVAGVALGVIILGGSLWGLVYVLAVEDDALSPPRTVLPEPQSPLVAGASDAGLAALRAAAVSDPAAQVELAALYLDGKGVPADPVRAARLLEEAAIQGHAEAQYRLALLYEDGRGPGKDATLALFWYDSAATRGSVDAAVRLGAFYAEGLAVPRDFARAASWYRRAAAAGDARAQFALGYLYENGLGVGRDGDEARRWWAKAAEGGSNEASARLDGRPAPAPFATGLPDGIVPTEAPSGSGSAANTSALDRNAIAEIQRLLKLLAFDPGASDGRVTDETRKAIRDYQSIAGLAADGEPSAELLTSLRAVSGADAPR